MVEPLIQDKQPSWDRDHILETLASLSYREQDSDGYFCEITRAATHYC